MDYERAYKEMKARVLEIGRGYVQGVDFSKPRQIAEYIDPELKESEDEKIMKDVVAAVETYGDFSQGRKEEIYAWLKSKGEQKPVEWDYPYGENETVDKLIAIAECLEMDGDCEFNGYTGTECGKFLRDLARKQVEYKSTDEVKLKFKVGDWITNGEYTWKVTDIKPLYYILQSQAGSVVSDTIFYVDKHFHLWTIQDAKDGNVLVNDNDIFVFDGTLEENMFPFAYCGIINGDFRIYDRKLPFTHHKNIYPATKEQRDLLSQKMKEAGYECDAEKKELKKIKQKSTNWSKEDEEMIDFMIEFIESLCWRKDLTQRKDNVLSWLKSLKDRVQPKQEWSEEDYLHLTNAILAAEKEWGTKSYTSKWLKSLKDRVQPKQEWNEDDEEKFRDVIRLVEQGAPVQSIRNHYTNWLKSLKDRVQPKQEWSEEDERHRKRIIERLEDIRKSKEDNIDIASVILSEINWFKSLKPHWKPSEEQMKHLKSISVGWHPSLDDCRILSSLYNDLLKL